MQYTLKARHLAVFLLAILAPTTAAIPAPQALTSMVTGSVTSQPIGHYEFCRAFPAECNQRLASRPAPKLTPHGWALLKKINSSVNGRIHAMTDKDIYGREEVWAYPKDVGDCEDFALLKRRELAAKGFSLADLLITVVRKPDGEGHAVLTVRTEQGDFVLDNLDNEVKPWYQTSYTFLKRQASFNTGRWVSIENGRDVVVGALR
ncbi:MULTISPECIES: transglutaminase-like cysteine peptidase [Pseudorhizobium]|jgi:predicted transglutaminase-like cysteine proteinase|nr:transglutaminase-like cysteine peptidase [Hyphomicrobiales bacterium]MBU1313378.1 transglutaminase-like cysteine peptidase [Alphaproteobacteria bacterium]MBU1549733.1 transglutaminase-like cysteine peptidase [Alphaproteobacteria bacterium]MBU2339178.1 transglutaminase-like cysteine peptidase [Alphaproteobacteria bacterium]MBU2389100.1 transglutaminase-like cysteine peptidase [Alphaproteobacteria bacterium]